MGTGGDVDTMGTILNLRGSRAVTIDVGNGWRCRYDGNYTIFTKCNKLSIVVGNGWRCRYDGNLSSGSRNNSTNSQVGNGWRCRYDGNPLMVMVPLLLVMMAVGNGWRCRYDGNPLHCCSLTVYYQYLSLGTGGDVDTMGTCWFFLSNCILLQLGKGG